MAPGFTSFDDGLDNSPNQVNEVIDEDELQYLKELKELKKNYRTAYKQLKDCKSETNFNQQAIDSLKQKLINCFEEWYADTFEEEATNEFTKGTTKAHMKSRGAVDSSALSSAVSQTSYIWLFKVLTLFVQLASPGKLIRDPEMDEDMNDEGAGDEGREGLDVDPDAAAYIRSRKNVLKLAAARKNQ